MATYACMSKDEKKEALVFILRELKVVEDGSTLGMPNTVIALIPEAIDKVELLLKDTSLSC